MFGCVVKCIFCWILFRVLIIWYRVVEFVVLFSWLKFFLCRFVVGRLIKFGDFWYKRMLWIKEIRFLMKCWLFLFVLVILVRVFKVGVLLFLVICRKYFCISCLVIFLVINKVLLMVICLLLKDSVWLRIFKVFCIFFLVVLVIIYRVFFW